ncbi:MAG: HAD hydrolase family protein [Thermoanaerobaculia bacterium]
MKPAAVLTDLDGTLLEHGGVLGAEARAAIARLRGLGVPVVPLTSKTEAELRALLADLDSGGVGSFENGAGIVSPSGVTASKKALPLAGLADRLAALARLSATPLTPVFDLSVAEIRRITGLAEERVPAMLERRFGLPFLAPDGAGPALEEAARAIPGVRLTRGGQFWHLSGDHGKEDALDLLVATGAAARPFAGFGDAPNDAGFLARCDVAILLPRATGGVDPALAAAVPGARVAPFPTGRGWAAALDELLAEDA